MILHIEAKTHTCKRTGRFEIWFGPFGEERISGMDKIWWLVKLSPVLRLQFEIKESRKKLDHLVKVRIILIIALFVEPFLSVPL